MEYKTTQILTTPRTKDAHEYSGNGKVKRLHLDYSRKLKAIRRREMKGIVFERKYHELISETIGEIRQELGYLENSRYILPQPISDTRGKRINIIGIKQVVYANADNEFLNHIPIDDLIIILSILEE